MTVDSLIELLYTCPRNAPVAIGTKLQLGAGDAAAISFKKLQIDTFSGIVVLYPTGEDDKDITFVAKENIVVKFEED